MVSGYMPTQVPRGMSAVMLLLARRYRPLPTSQHTSMFLLIETGGRPQSIGLQSTTAFWSGFCLSWRCRAERRSGFGLGLPWRCLKRPTATPCSTALSLYLTETLRLASAVIVTTYTLLLPAALVYSQLTRAPTDSFTVAPDAPLHLRCFSWYGAISTGAPHHSTTGRQQNPLFATRMFRRLHTARFCD